MRLSHTQRWQAKLFHPDAIGFIEELPDGYIPHTVQFFSLVKGPRMCLIDGHVADLELGHAAIRLQQSARK